MYIKRGYSAERYVFLSDLFVEVEAVKTELISFDVVEARRIFYELGVEKVFDGNRKWIPIDSKTEPMVEEYVRREFRQLRGEVKGYVDKYRERFGQETERVCGAQSEFEFRFDRVDPRGFRNEIDSKRVYAGKRYN